MFRTPQGSSRPDNTLYETLGISRSATQQEIKRAYRTLATKHHPDKPQGDEERFKKINAAHEVLIDEEKRKIYDRYGLSGLQREQQRQSSGASGSSMADEAMLADLFGSFFGSRMGAAAGGGGGANFSFQVGGDGGTFFSFTQRTSNRRAQEPIIIEKVDVELEDVFQRRAFAFDVSVKRKNEGCLEQAKHKFNVTYTCWNEFKKPVYLRGKGNQSLDSQVSDGDIAVRAKLLEHAHFEPCNTHDLILRHTLSYADALCGFDFEVPFIDANRTLLRFSNYACRDEVIQAGTVFMTRCGLPLSGIDPPTTYQISDSTSHEKFGILFVVFDVETPESMSQEEREALSKRLVSRSKENNTTSEKPETFVKLTRASPQIEYQLANNLNQQKAEIRARKRAFSKN